MTQTSRDDKLLEGFIVVDFTRALAGPYCTRLLADLGATVIKVERPGEGDEVRYAGLQLDEKFTDQSAYFARVNAGKRSVSVDMANPDSRALLLDLIGKADVLVENFAPGVMAKYKLDYATLKDIKPELIYCSISGFGQTGPMSSFQAYAHLINAVSGMMELDRQGDPSPKASNLQAADVLAGLHAFGVINASLIRRARSGRGAYIDVSMLECLIAADDLTYPMLLNGAPVERKPRVGLGVYPVKDRHMALQIGGGSGMWPRMVGLLGKPELLTDERFATPAARREHWSELVAIITQWLTRFDDVHAAVAEVGKARIPCQAVMMPEEVVELPHLKARQAFPEMPHPGRGKIKITASPFFLDGSPTIPARPAPYRIGQDTREMLKTVAGYSDAQVDALVASKAVTEPN